MSKTFKKLNVVKDVPAFCDAVGIVEVSLVPPKDNQVLIKNFYAGVNALDFNVMALKYFSPEGKVPFDIGMEAMGVIEALGKDVTTLKVGQPVCLIDMNGRCYAEYIYAAPDEVIPVPAVKPQFIGLLICGLTASIGLDEAGRLKAGDKVLITASAGGTGHIAVQWAKQKGCYVIGMTSSTEKAKVLKGLGVDRVINYKTENLDEVLTQEYPTGIDVVWETIGGKVFETLFKHLAPKGRFIIIGGISVYFNNSTTFDPNLPDLPTTLLMKNQTLTGFTLSQYSELHSKYLKQLITDFTINKLKIILDMGQNSEQGQFFGLESAVKGGEYLHSSKNTGKVVIKVQNQ